MLKELFVEAFNLWNRRTAVERPTEGSPVYDHFKKKLEPTMNQIITDLGFKGFIVKASVGMGNWAEIPWIGIRHDNAAKSFEEGEYVVYLFSPDFKDLYLSIIQGVSKLKTPELEQKVADLRKKIIRPKDFSDDITNQLAKDQPLGSKPGKYQKGSIYTKLYESSQIPDDTVLIEDLKGALESYQNYVDSLVRARYIVADLAWNDYRWTKPQIPPESGHRYVAEGNMPSETLDFKFDKEVDTPEVVYGFFQCHGIPRAFAENKARGKIIFFYSNRKIVGIYGNAQFLENRVPYRNKELGEDVSFNISGERRMSLGFLPEAYIEALEPHINGKRVGQVGFNYLETSNAKRILEDVADKYEKIVELSPQNSEAREHLVKLRTLLETLGAIEPFMKEAAQHFLELLSEKKQVILYGPPGTGKTFQAQKLAVEFLFDKNNG
jgi:SpoVK/Ycf46/Vps4 family AAA+-type ATPase